MNKIKIKFLGKGNITSTYLLSISFSSCPHIVLLKNTASLMFSVFHKRSQIQASASSQDVKVNDSAHYSKIHRRMLTIS